MANEPVNIVYPINGGAYPRTDPVPGGLSSAYLTFSFSVTIGGGPVRVTWGINRAVLGEARCYDQFSAQQVWKMRGGRHRFWVRASRGGTTHSDAVTFAVGT